MRAREYDDKRQTNDLPGVLSLARFIGERLGNTSQRISRISMQ